MDQEEKAKAKALLAAIKRVAKEAGAEVEIAGGPPDLDDDDRKYGPPQPMNAVMIEETKLMNQRAKEAARLMDEHKRKVERSFRDIQAAKDRYFDILHEQHPDSEAPDGRNTVIDPDNFTYRVELAEGEELPLPPGVTYAPVTGTVQ